MQFHPEILAILPSLACLIAQTNNKQTTHREASDKPRTALRVLLFPPDGPGVCTEALTQALT